MPEHFLDCMYIRAVFQKVRREGVTKRMRSDEAFRADGLNRVLYKCPHCQTEGSMEGKGIHLCCKSCGKVWELDEYGTLQAEDGNVYYDQIPDWFAWERACVRTELEEGRYKLDLPVKIRMMVDTNCLYMDNRKELLLPPFRPRCSSSSHSGLW